jgi:acetate kinase
VSNLIVVINAGSATVKFAVYDVASGGDGGRATHRGIAELSADGARFSVVNESGAMLVDQPIDIESSRSEDIQALLDYSLKWLKRSFVASRMAFGHRVVHGGDAFGEPILLNDHVLAKLDSYVPLAPLHQPYNLAAIRAIQQLWPDIPQVACFDTAFHLTQPRLARMFGLPVEYFDEGVKRYGFHGLSYEFIASVLPNYLGDLADGRVIVAHLGSGASLCAMRERRSVATTMGFTALDGLLMGTRCGAIDPGVILHLLIEKKLSAEQITDVLYRRSGLLGVSGFSADMRELLESESPRAAEAVALFVYGAARQIGSLIAALGGLDALIFTGGIGSHSAAIRQRICESSAWSGIHLDSTANVAHETRISAADSSVSVWALPTDEEQIIAGHTLKLASNSVASPANR